MASREFELTPHEELNGVKQFQGGLHYRPVARAWAGGVVALGLTGLLSAAALLGGQLYVLPVLALVAAYVAPGLRTRVRVDAQQLVVQNRTSRKQIPLDGIAGFDFVDLKGFRWSVLQPGIRSTPGARWRCPRVRTTRGETVELEALACPHDETVLGASVAEIRLGALERWVRTVAPEPDE